MPGKRFPIVTDRGFESRPEHHLDINGYTLSQNQRFNFRCPHQLTHTYEKSSSECVSRVALLRGVQAALIILSSSLCFSSVFSSIRFFFGWPERGNHLFARPGAFKGPLRSLPIRTPDRFRSCGSRAYQPRETTHTVELRTFHPFTH